MNHEAVMAELKKRSDQAYTDEQNALQKEQTSVSIASKIAWDRQHGILQAERKAYGEAYRMVKGMVE